VSDWGNGERDHLAKSPLLATNARNGAPRVFRKGKKWATRHVLSSQSNVQVILPQHYEAAPQLSIGRKRTGPASAVECESPPKKLRELR
jgi:hypothetical protein